MKRMQGELEKIQRESEKQREQTKDTQPDDGTNKEWRKGSWALDGTMRRRVVMKGGEMHGKGSGSMGENGGAAEENEYG